VTQLLDGSEGIRSLDNLTVSASGKVVLQETPATTRASPRCGTTTRDRRLGRTRAHDPAKFGGDTAPAVVPFTQDEESSGVVDVTGIFGKDGGKPTCWTRRRTTPSAPRAAPAATEIVEGGQLMLMRVDADAVFA
jgi:hypothetical protein